MTRANEAPWFAKAGAASGIMPISYFVGSSIFALKGGGYGCFFSLTGIDMESRTDEDLNVRVRGVEASLLEQAMNICANKGIWQRFDTNWAVWRHFEQRNTQVNGGSVEAV